MIPAALFPLILCFIFVAIGFTYCILYCCSAVSTYPVAVATGFFSAAPHADGSGAEFLPSFGHGHCGVSSALGNIGDCGAGDFGGGDCGGGDAGDCGAVCV